MMSENSPVKEKECDDRKKELYKEIKANRTDIDTMKGGIAVF